MDDQVDIFPLVHQSRKGQSFIFIGKLREFIGDIVRNRRRRIVGLFGERQQYARVAVDAGVDCVAVVAQEHICHIGQLDIAKSVDMEQIQILDLREIRQLIPHADQIADAVLLYVAGRHRKILSLQYAGDHIQRDHRAEARVRQRLITGRVQLCHRGIQLRLL